MISRPSRAHPRWLLLLPILIGSWYLAGCGIASEADVGSPAGTAADSSDAVAVESDRSAITGGADEVLAVEPYTLPGVDVDLLEVKRTGADVLTVRWSYRGHGTEERRLAESDDPYRLSRDAYLVDRVNQKTYLVVTDESDRPVASPHRSGSRLMLLPGQALTAWAKFPAPPPDVARISIYLPGVDPFEDIAIAR